MVECLFLPLALLFPFSFHRFAYDKLQTFVIPKNMIDSLDLQSVVIRSKPFEDTEVCFASYTVSILQFLCVACIVVVVGPHSPSLTPNPTSRPTQRPLGACDAHTMIKG